MAQGETNLKSLINLRNKSKKSVNSSWIRFLDGHKHIDTHMHTKYRVQRVGIYFEFKVGS